MLWKQNKIKSRYISEKITAILPIEVIDKGPKIGFMGFYHCLQPPMEGFGSIVSLLVQPMNTEIFWLNFSGPLPLEISSKFVEVLKVNLA
jgi:hypothetical protein